MTESRRPVFSPSRTTSGIAKSVGGSRAHSRVDRTRRSWSDNEEMVLLSTLKELVARGWKTDNGFKSGSLAKAEEALRKEFPTSGLKANPHIQSKIHTWKKFYGAPAPRSTNGARRKLFCEDLDSLDRESSNVAYLNNSTSERRWSHNSGNTLRRAPAVSITTPNYSPGVSSTASNSPFAPHRSPLP